MKVWLIFPHRAWNGLYECVCTHGHCYSRSTNDCNCTCESTKTHTLLLCMLCCCRESTLERASQCIHLGYNQIRSSHSILCHLLATYNYRNMDNRYINVFAHLYCVFSHSLLRAYSTCYVIMSICFTHARIPSPYPWIFEFHVYDDFVLLFLSY